MIGVSGNCVARTPANLARKKKKLGERKLKGKKSAGKKSAGKKKAPKSDLASLRSEYDALLASMMSVTTCPEGSGWNDYTGRCECDDDHEFNEELQKCVKRESFEKLGFPEAETIEDIMAEIGSPPEGPPRRKRGSRTCEYPQTWSDDLGMCVHEKSLGIGALLDPEESCPEDEYWSEKHQKCRKNKGYDVV